MKASELIQQLQELIKEHGNKEVLHYERSFLVPADASFTQEELHYFSKDHLSPGIIKSCKEEGFILLS